MHPIINIAFRAAKDAADALAFKTDRLDRIKILDDSDERFHTSADLESDNTLLYHIQKSYPDHTIVSRLSGTHEGKVGEPIWYVDPLLGNQNFAYGYPRFGVSIAVKNKDVVNHAVVLAPMLGDEFIASRGNGAQLNTRRIRVRQKTELTASLIGLDFAGIDSDLFIDMQKALLRANAKPRVSGCGPLDLLDAACGRIQGGWFGHQTEASIAAASLIFQEAGGFIGAENGNPKLDSGSEILFGEAELFKQLVKIRMRLKS